jgi:hypothetical protein
MPQGRLDNRHHRAQRDDHRRGNAILEVGVLQPALHKAVTQSGVKRFEVRLWGTPTEIHPSVVQAANANERVSDGSANEKQSRL